MADFDLAVIGGGINGAGIARDAAGRGIKVLLVEQNDLASGTSSASSKLVHGGLRYLEQGEFRLVREALAEREVLMRIAPHVVRPMRFVLPAQPGMRSPAVLRAGLFLYDHLTWRRSLPATRTLDLSHDPLAAPLRRQFRYGFEYSDCWVDDARLVVLNAMDAAARGAAVRTRTRCTRAERGETWRLVLSSRGRRDVVTARALVNATGPWVGTVADTVLRQPLPGQVRLDKGSHIVVRRMFEHDRGYILQAEDGRVVFALPFERDFTLIGTTDQGFRGDLAVVTPSADEIRYLCNVANAYFRHHLDPLDVIWAYAGVRALYDDGSGKPQDLTRDYLLALDERRGEAPLLTVIGGKISTHRRLAETAMDRLARYFAARPAWTGLVALPGGDTKPIDLDRRVRDAAARWPFLAEDYVMRLVGAYGSRAERIVGEATTFADLGECFGADLTAAEVRYLMAEEWAQTEDDILWRRSKLGLRFSSAEREALARFMTGAIGRTG